jgi:hypothetical protein
MIIIQTKHIPKIKETLVIKHDTCTIQENNDELGFLDEYLIPILYNNNEFTQDVHVDIDDILLGFVKQYEFMIVYTTRVDFGQVTYKFKSTQAEHFNTRLPKCSFICILPNFKFDCEVTFQHSWISLDNGITHELELIHEIDTCVYDDIRINGRYLEPGLCKVYKNDNFPICLEYIRDGYIKRRFISPIE